MSKGNVAECGAGWAKLYEPLVARCETEGVEVAQIKEKFGGLRFYTNGGGSDELYAAIEKAERDSHYICEECGESGAMRKGSWLKTLCDEHAKGRKALVETVSK